MTGFFRSALLAAALLTGCGSSPSLPLPTGGLKIAEVLQNPGGDNRLFKRYQAADFSEWNPGWPSKVDMSGVAFDTQRAATAITPRHVVMADHYSRPPGSHVIFHDRKGWPVDRVIVKLVPLRQAGVQTDIAVGLLDRPLPPSIRCYPLFAPSADLPDLLLGAPVIVTDQMSMLFIHRINYINTNRIDFAFAPDIALSLRKNLIFGDSGHPSFAVLRGETVLVETHTFGGPGTGPFYSSAEVFPALSKVVRDLDPTYSLKVVKPDAEFIREAAKHRPPPPAPPQAPPAPVNPPPAMGPWRTPSSAPAPPPKPGAPRPRVIVPPPSP